MRTKAERRVRHSRAPRVSPRTNPRITANKDKIIKSSGKAFKVVKQGNQQYFVKLQLTK
jgi:hypothetical protein